jgi:choline-glycine betaine transporter
MRLVEFANAALEAGASKQIFDHVKNYLICAMLLAIGTTELSDQDSMLFGLVSNQFSGVGVIGIAVILITLNLYDGVKRLSRFRFHLILTLGLVSLYVFMSLRVVEMALNFRIWAPLSIANLSSGL